MATGPGAFLAPATIIELTKIAQKLLGFAGRVNRDESGSSKQSHQQTEVRSR